MISDKLQIERASGDARVLRLCGPLTLNTLFAFQDVIRSEPPMPTIIDLRSVPYVDSAGLGALVNAFVSHQNNGHLFLLAEVPERVLSLLRMTRLDAVLPTCSTCEAAEQRLRRGSVQG